MKIQPGHMKPQAHSRLQLPKGGSRAADLETVKPRNLVLHRSPKELSQEKPKPNAETRPTFNLNRILVAIDFSDCCRRALHFAVRLARPLKASLVLLYVAEIDPPGAELKPNHLAGLEMDLRRLTKKEFAILQKQEIPKDIPSEIHICAGRSDREILAAAERMEIGLIIMGTHSNESQQGQLGTTAGRVASLAKCPVVMVPMLERCVPFFI